MNIKMHAGYLWVVGFEVQVLKFMFMVCDFQLAKTNVALSPKHAMFPCVYFRACATCVWKPVPGCLEVNNAFTTCH